MKFIETRWPKFVMAVHVFGLIFSLVALILTVYAVDRMGAHETIESTRIIFSTYGIYGGGVIIGLIHFITKIFFPIILLFAMSKFEDGNPGVLVNILVWSFIGAYGVFNFISGFLDMFTDVFVLSSFIQGFYKSPLFTGSTIISMGFQLSLLVFGLSLLFRTFYYLNSQFSKR